MKLAGTLLILMAAFAFSDDGDFPGNQVDTLFVLIENSGPEMVIEFIETFESVQRLQLYELAREILVFSDWDGKNLDYLVTVSDAGIEEALSQANNASNSFSILIFLDKANEMSYNLAADLAICWPGDTLTREIRHFQRGLSAALQCIEWRHELGKGEYPFFIAYWAAGIHQLSLGRPREAVYNFVKSLNHAQQYTIDEGRALGLAPHAGFELILAHGYLGIALDICGDDDDQYERAIGAFVLGLDEYPQYADDYRFGIEQLEWARGRLTGE